MAKKEPKTIQSVELKDPSQVIELKNLGMRVTKDNLTVERYQQLVSLSDSFKQYFNVKFNPKQNEMETKG